MHAGKMRTDYGRSVCERIVAQVSGLLVFGGATRDGTEMLDLLEIKRVLCGMMIRYGQKGEKRKVPT